VTADIRVRGSRKKGIRNSTPRQILLFSTILMFSASTALASVDTAIYLVQFLDGDFIPTSNKLQLACEVLFDSLVSLPRRHGNFG
jgi:hypothetical protein